MVEKGILESAVRVLVTKEIEEAGRRVGSRLAEAFGQLAKAAGQSVDVVQDIQAMNGSIVIRLAYNVDSGKLVGELGEQGEQGRSYGIDEQMIYTGPEEPAEASDEELERLADDLAADNAANEDDELEINPDDIEMIEEGPEIHIDTV